MSTFKGIMHEYDNISIDRFDGENLKSTAYFLSHCHQDHMIGLNTSEFFTTLRDSVFPIKLYVSIVTRDILINDAGYKHLEPFVVALEVGVSTSVKIPIQNHGYILTVTLVEAGHCPGSVMFLFEGFEGTVLYTGDFRLPCGSAARCPFFRINNDIDNGLKEIKSVYIDTTFCTPESSAIPSRECSRDVLINNVKQWISRSDAHFVHLHLPAQYGYEYLFVELFKAFKFPVHVDCDKVSKFFRIDKITEAITTDNRSTKIHACYKSNNIKGALPCGYHSRQLQVRTIKVSARWFTMYTSVRGVIKHEEGEYYRLFFSTHSTLEEVRDFLAFLKPKNVYANVIEGGRNEKEIVTRIYNAPIRGEVGSDEIHLLGDLRTQNMHSEQSSQESDLVFDAELCSPIKIKQASESQETDTSQEYCTRTTHDEEAKTGQKNEDVDGTPSKLRSGDSTPDSFTPDPNSSPEFLSDKRKHTLKDELNSKRKKLFL